MTATRKQHSTKRHTKRKQAAAQPKPAAVLYVAFELSWNEWKLAFGTGPLENPRLKNVGGRDTQQRRHRMPSVVAYHLRATTR